MHAADMTTILLDLALILLLARIVGWLFTKIGQPAVVGEILAGVLLGPSLLGNDVSEWLFPLDSRPYLSLLANIGLVLFMFVVGLELDVSLVKGRGRVAASVSVCSILLPFTLGITLATQLADEHNAGGDFWPFALFIGAAMSVTAFPVLARILTDRNMHHTETGGLALACAATDDVLAWTLLAVVIGISGGAAADASNPWVVALAIPFAFVALVVIRPQLNRLTTAYHRAGRLTPSILAYVLLGLLVFSAITEYLHVHFIFGAFLFGAIMPQQNAAALRHEILVRLEQISVLLLLPVFFLVSGLNVDVRGLGGDNVLQLVLILAVAIGGKYLGAYVGARASGVRPWQSRALGILMNTRGLTELVILNVGRELGLIGDELFTMLVVMALVTTMMTGPLLRLAYPEKRVARDIAEAERAALGGDAAGQRALVISAPGTDDERRLDVAISCLDRTSTAEVVVASLQRQRNRKLDMGSGLTEELAEITETMERLEVLVRRGEAVGVPVKIVSHLSADVTADLVALTTALQPEFVVLGSQDDAAGAVSAAAEGQLLVIRPSGPRSNEATSVRARWSPGADGDAATLLACRMAAFLHVPLRLEAVAGSSGRRLQAVREQLARRGMAAADDGPEEGTPFTVGPISDASADLGVRAEVDPIPVDWRRDDLGLEQGSVPS